MSTLEDMCDYGLAAALAIVVAFALLLLALEFVARMLCRGIAGAWRFLTRPCQ